MQNLLASATDGILLDLKWKLRGIYSNHLNSKKGYSVYKLSVLVLKSLFGGYSLSVHLSITVLLFKSCNCLRGPWLHGMCVSGDEAGFGVVIPFVLMFAT